MGQIDAKDASVEIAQYIRAIMSPPPEGAPVGDILGAYIFRAVLRDAGYAVVPLVPDSGMKAAFRTGWFKSFRHRYGALLEASWPQPSLQK
jgi:hypothetical protein